MSMTTAYLHVEKNRIVYTFFVSNSAYLLLQDELPMEDGFLRTFRYGDEKFYRNPENHYLSKDIQDALKKEKVDVSFSIVDSTKSRELLVVDGDNLVPIWDFNKKGTPLGALEQAINNGELDWGILADKLPEMSLDWAKKNGKPADFSKIRDWLDSDLDTVVHARKELLSDPKNLLSLIKAGKLDNFLPSFSSYDGDEYVPNVLRNFLTPEVQSALEQRYMQLNGTNEGVMEELNNIRRLAGIPALQETKKLDEGVVGGMQPIPKTVSNNVDSEMEKWMKIVSESETEEATQLNEHVVGDLQNGYDRQHKTTKYHSDYFPSGATSNVVDDAGPASSDQGDNPMQKAGEVEYRDEIVEGKEIHKDLVYQYRDYISE